jgi:uncharacterized protein (TIGR03435 family)
MLFLRHIPLACVLVAALTQSPAFEVASVKPAAPNAGPRGSMRGGPGTPDPGQIAFTNVTLASVLLRAYAFQNYQLAAPAWMSSRRYDIAARIPPDTTPEQFNQMLQNLLVERFQITLHRETKLLQGFELVAVRNGSKLKSSTEAAAPQSVQPSSPPKTNDAGFPVLDRPGLAMMEGVKGRAVISFLTARAQPLSALVEMLSREFRMPILDRTNLTGNFDFTLEFAPQPPGAAPSPEVNDDAAPNLMTSVQDQLGLKLTPAKVPTEILIIDRADPTPTRNEL